MHCGLAFSDDEDELDLDDEDDDAEEDEDDDESDEDEDDEVLYSDYIADPFIDPYDPENGYYRQMERLGIFPYGLDESELNTEEEIDLDEGMVDRHIWDDEDEDDEDDEDDDEDDG